MKKILFLHGFYASGQCVPALALREAFEGRVEVLTPDLPMHPKEAIKFLRELIDREKPDLLVGNSCGSFYAQMLAPIVLVLVCINTNRLERMESRISSSTMHLSRNLPNSNQFSSTAAIHTIRIASGDCLAKEIP